MIADDVCPLIGVIYVVCRKRLTSTGVRTVLVHVYISHVTHQHTLSSRISFASTNTRECCRSGNDTGDNEEHGNEEFPKVVSSTRQPVAGQSQKMVSQSLCLTRSAIAILYGLLLCCCYVP